MSQTVLTLADDLWSNAVSVVRFYRGSWVRHGGARRWPQKPLELHDAEVCPFSRKVREGLSELDLDWICRPTPRGSRRPQPHPRLIDPNTDVCLTESEDILDYLHERYGAGRPHSALLTAPLNTLSSIVASVIRRRGTTKRYGDREQPEFLLELYQFEGCPYCRKVRERLHELDLDFRVRSMAKGSPRRAELHALGGKVLVPYLVDPNEGVAMYESDDINRYLRATYG